MFCCRRQHPPQRIALAYAQVMTSDDEQVGVWYVPLTQRYYFDFLQDWRGHGERAATLRANLTTVEMLKKLDALGPQLDHEPLTACIGAQACYAYVRKPAQRPLFDRLLRELNLKLYKVSNLRTLPPVPRASRSVAVERHC
jgi:hypothetical protein